MSKQCQLAVSTSKQKQMFIQQKGQYLKNSHIKGHLLPKIHKAAALSKARHNEHICDLSTKAMINESDEKQKRLKMALIINDYIENFKAKQKGPILAFSSQKSKFEQKPIIVEGVSHLRFAGLQSSNFNKKSFSLDLKAQVKRKKSCTILQKVKRECKIQAKKTIQKFKTQQSNSLSSAPDLKDYVLKAKKSLIDNRQKIQHKKYILKRQNSLQPWVTQF